MHLPPTIQKAFPRGKACTLATGVACVLLCVAAGRADVPLTIPIPVSIFINGNLEEAENNWPKHWPGGDAKYIEENGNHFFRLESRGADEMVNFFYYKLDVPQGFENLELKFRTRYNNVRHGKERWNDARIIMNFIGKDGTKTGAPPVGFTGSSDWRWITHKFGIPAGAVALEFMPTHFNTASGTFDLDDLSLCGVDPVQAFKPLTQQSTLVVKGNRIFDQTGREIWLQGVNIPSLEWWHEGDHLRESFAAALQDWNVTVIRFAVKTRFWFGRDPEQKRRGVGATEYCALVDEMIDYATKRGCYIVLDLHEYRAPTQEHAEFWKDASKRYANHPGVLFDMINEPYDISWDEWRNGGSLAGEKREGTVAETSEGKNLNASIGMQKLLETIRTTGAKNIVIAGGLDWSYDLTGVADGFALEEKGGNGIMYATHIYPWKSDWNGKILAVAEKHPVFVGEVGCQNKPMEYEKVLVDPYQWAPDMFAFIQKHKLHWSAWSFHTGASPCVISDWNFTPTPYWGTFVRSALRGAKFTSDRVR